MSDNAFADLNEAFQAKARLGIMTLLATQERDFAALKSGLALTDGNLGAHLRVLEELGYVAIAKSFVNRKPRSTVSLTAHGRHAFTAYLDQLEAIIRMAKG